jgi:hypothetical protein
VIVIVEPQILITPASSQSACGDPLPALPEIAYGAPWLSMLAFISTQSCPCAQAPNSMPLNDTLVMPPNAWMQRPLVVVVSFMNCGLYVVRHESARIASALVVLSSTLAGVVALPWIVTNPEPIQDLHTTGVVYVPSATWIVTLLIPRSSVAATTSIAFWIVRNGAAALRPLLALLPVVAT